MKPSSPDASITRVPDPKTYTMVEGGGLPPGGIFARRLSPGGSCLQGEGVIFGYLLSQFALCPALPVPVVACLHWSAVRQRIVFKTAVLVSKSRHDGT